MTTVGQYLRTHNGIYMAYNVGVAHAVVISLKGHMIVPISDKVPWDLITNMPTARYDCLVAVLPTKEMMVVGERDQEIASIIINRLAL